MTNSTITGVGSYLPAQRVSSVDLMIEVDCQDYGLSPEHLEKLTGIKERRWADSSVEPGDLAIKASEIALKNARIRAVDIDLIIFCGMEGNQVEPSTAHRIQNAIGAEPCECIDLSSACHGFMDGLRAANRAIKSGECVNVLVCTGEASGRRNHAMFKMLREKHLSKHDFLNLMGYLSLGDGGGASIISATEGQNGFQHFLSESRGQYADYCFYEYHNNGGFVGQMLMPKMSELFRQKIIELIPPFYAAMNWKTNSMDQHVDYLISHQIGRKPHQQLIELTGVPAEKAISSYQMQGNLTSATIPFNLSQIDMDTGKVIFGVAAGSGATITFWALTL